LGLGAVVVLVAIAGLVILKRRSARERPLLARDVFHMPERMEPFIVVKLLRNLLASDRGHIWDAQRQALADEMRRVELACFEPDGEGLPESELRRVAQEALKICC